jgi:hypothetical protein
LKLTDPKPKVEADTHLKRKKKKIKIFFLKISKRNETKQNVLKLTDPNKSPKSKPIFKKKERK